MLSSFALQQRDELLRPLGEEHRVLLLQHRVLHRMDPAHVQAKQGLFPHRGDADARREVHLVGGIEGRERALEVDFLSRDLREGRPHCLSAAFARLPGQDEKKVVPVRNAVEVHQELLLHGLSVYGGKPAGAQQPVLLMVEEDEGALRPLLLAHAGHRFHQRQHAGGVVVHRVGVRRAEEEHIEHRAQAEKDAQEGAGRPEPRRQQRRQGEDQHQEGQRDQHAVAQVDQDILRRDKVREGQSCAGVIVGGENHLRRLHIPQHQVAAAGKAPLLHAQAGDAALHHFNERQLLLFCFPYLPVLQDLV